MRSVEGAFQDPAQLGQYGGTERRQVGADVGVLVERVSHLRSAYVEAMEAVHDRAVGRPGVVGHAAVEEAMNTSFAQ